MVDMLEEEKASKVIFGLVFQPILNQQYIKYYYLLSINPAPKNDRNSKNLTKVGQTLTAIHIHTASNFVMKVYFCNSELVYCTYTMCKSHTQFKTHLKMNQALFLNLDQNYIFNI